VEPEDIDAAVAEVRALEDVEARTLKAHRFIQAMTHALQDFSDIRTDGVRSLRAVNPRWRRYADIAERLGLRVERPVQAAQSIVRGRRSKREQQP
jgi:hypothetical protein